MSQPEKMIKGPGQGVQRAQISSKANMHLSLTSTKFREKTAQLIKMYCEAEANKTVVLSHRQRKEF